jgi:hypothetical protein
MNGASGWMRVERASSGHPRPRAPMRKIIKGRGNRDRFGSIGEPVGVDDGVATVWVMVGLLGS